MKKNYVKPMLAIDTLVTENAYGLVVTSDESDEALTGGRRGNSKNRGVWGDLWSNED